MDAQILDDQLAPPDAALLVIEDLEERSELSHGACACTCSCGCTSCSCVAWA